MPDKRLTRMLYMERKAVEWYNIYGAVPQLLNEMANYLLSLCGNYVQQALTILSQVPILAPVISTPANQSVLVGANAVFSVTVTSSVSYTIQWYLNGIAIPGATGLSYTFMNAQLTDSGDLLTASATNSAGTIVSGSATLTVTEAIIGAFAYMDIDPGPQLLAHTDPFSYQVSFPVTHNAPLSITVPGAATPNKYLIVRVPIGESVKTIWNNTPLNNGTIPDSVWQTFVQFGGNTYYYTRNAETMDSTASLILS